jgi:putative FmdB family regulatory protein
MPIYDYKCSDCGKTYDVFHKVREIKEDVVCPTCNSTVHVRLISAPSFSMNGSSGSGYSSEAAPSCADGSCCAGACGVN